MTWVYNKKEETHKRKRLRKEMPLAERLLWQKLKGKQAKGYKFRRQYGVGLFVVDFYCVSLKLAIELDGESHYVDENARKKDATRQLYIEGFGIRFLRFTNTEIVTNMDGVLQIIEGYLP